MSSSGYTPWVVTVGEQPTTAMWNILGQNDASFNTGTGMNDDVINFRHIANNVIPTGVTWLWPGVSAPSSDWLICDGSAVSRSAYAALFAVCGTMYGNGDGSTTFNLPTLSKQFPVGYGAGDPNFGTMGQTGGESAHTLNQNELPYFELGVYDPGHAHGLTNQVAITSNGTQRLQLSGGGQAFNATSNVIAGAGTGVRVFSNGGNAAHNNLPPYTVINYIIKT